MYKNTKSAQQGFTLIELMIVIAIVGILMVVGVPLYQDYTHKAQATALMAATSPAKMAVVEYVTVKGKLPTPADVSFSQPAADLVTSVAWDDSADLNSDSIKGAVIVNGDAELSSMKIALEAVPTKNTGGAVVSVAWKCYTNKPEWAPASCAESASIP